MGTHSRVFRQSKRPPSLAKSALTHHFSSGGTSYGSRCALTQRARQIRCRSFSVNSDGFVNYKTMYQFILIHNSIFNTLSEF